LTKGLNNQPYLINAIEVLQVLVSGREGFGILMCAIEHLQKELGM